MPVPVLLEPLSEAGSDFAKPDFLKRDLICMSRIVPLIDVQQVAEGKSAEVTAEGRIFAVYRIDGVFHVIDGICPHAGGPLGKGSLRNGIVTCPWHGWQFDVQNGRHCLNDRICQTVYQTVIQNDVLCVDLPD